MQQLEALRDEARQTNDSLTDELVRVKEELITATRESERAARSCSELSTDLQTARKELSQFNISVVLVVIVFSCART